jgi:hypothetical protein
MPSIFVEISHRLNVTKVMCLKESQEADSRPLMLCPSRPERGEIGENSVIQGIGNWPEFR